MRFHLTFFQGPKKAKLMAIFTGALFGLFLAAAAGFFLSAQFRLHTWETADALVSDFSTTDPSHVWTQFTYQVGQADYTVRQKGHSYWMVKGSTVSVLYNPENPEQFCISDTIFARPRVLLGISGIWFFFFLLMGGNYIRVLQKRRSPSKIPTAHSGTFFIDAVFALRPPEQGVIAAGKVKCGLLAEGDFVFLICPDGSSCGQRRINAMESSERKKIPYAGEGEFCSVLLENISTDQLSPGMVLQVTPSEGQH